MDDIPHGVGVLLMEGDIFYGEFELGLLVGRGCMTFQNGNFYVGEFENGNMRGFGRYSASGVETYKFNDSVIS
jgi:hypothetical protein